MKHSYEYNAQIFIKRYFSCLTAMINIMHKPRERRSIANKIQEEFYTMYHRKVLIHYGISRLAFITSNYVIKIDYSDEGFGTSEDELMLYELAQQDGYAYLFAKPTKFEYNNITFYIMPRVYGIKGSHYDAEHYMTDDELHWCSKHNLSDLHNGNFGLSHHKITIFDYAAWYCDDTSYNSYGA